MPVNYPPIPTSPGFDIVRLGGNIGAEIRGLDLARPLPAE